MKRDSQKYQEFQFLGKGARAEVYKARKGNQQFAIKKINSLRLRDPDFQSIINREVQIMGSIQHDRIIKLYEVIKTQQEWELILQYAPGGSLYNHLQKYDKIPQDQVKRYIWDIISALEYIHNRSQPILHRDIKPQNILLDAQGRCKLADFGQSNIMLHGKQRNSYVGTQQYMAPQVSNSQAQSQSVDLWSVGVLIYELLIGKCPKKQQQQFPPFISRSAQDVIKKLLQQDPSIRMNLKQLKNHIWLSDLQQSLPIQPQKACQERKQQIFKQIKSAKQKIYEKLKQKQQSKIMSLVADQPYSPKKKIKNKTAKQQAIEIAQQHIQLLKKKAQVKYQIEMTKLWKKAKQEQIQFKKMQREQQLQRWKQKILQYEQNMKKLRSSPLTFEYQIKQQFQDLEKKIKRIKNFILRLTQRTQNSIYEFPPIITKSSFIAQSQHISTLMIQILQMEKACLLALKSSYKNKITL